MSTLDDLRTQVVAITPPPRTIARPVAGQLVEVATWGSDAPLDGVRSGDRRLGGLADDDVLRLARARSIAVTSETLDFLPVGDAPLTAEVVTSLTQPHVAACLIEMLAHADPTRVHVVAPLTWRHWLLHAATDATDRAAIVRLRALAVRLVATIAHPEHERLATGLLFWPGNRTPVPIVFDDGGAPLPTAEMIDMMPAWR